MQINEIIAVLDLLAPPVLQEPYDNAGLLCGDGKWECTGILVALDATEPIIEEAVARGCNLVVAHHPIVFGGLKKITGKNYVERTVIQAIKQDVAIFAIHTNLDNVRTGVNGKIAALLGLEQTRVLLPKQSLLRKLVSFVPHAYLDAVRDALFGAGGGQTGAYSECSFSVSGTGTFKAEAGANPFIGEKGLRHNEGEIRLEMIYPVYREAAIVQALLNDHPYEEVAYDLVALQNDYQEVGSGILGYLPNPVSELDFLGLLKATFKVPVIRHSPLLHRPIKKVAVCGGAGSFMIAKALQVNADAYVTADLKYHEFFDANGRILLADIGHFESEQYTIDLLYDILAEKFPTFAVFKTGVITNPVNYYR